MPGWHSFTHITEYMMVINICVCIRTNFDSLLNYNNKLEHRLLHQWQWATNLQQERLKISASADGGPRSRVCARETLRSAPHRH